MLRLRLEDLTSSLRGKIEELSLFRFITEIV
uniref:Uncharacterized protein n=1 Tax=Podoviridae sp. cttxo15 TaxID=2826584 RepID=A0A8S5N1J4_9CAUD|nr:MAG TPA: hypothetical protein [Podoviridae sp. cttxo15]